MTTPLPAFTDASAAFKGLLGTLATDTAADQAAATELVTAQEAKASTAKQLATDASLIYAAGQTLIAVITAQIAPFAPSAPAPAPNSTPAP